MWLESVLFDHLVAAIRTFSNGQSYELVKRVSVCTGVCISLRVCPCLYLCVAGGLAHKSVPLCVLSSLAAVLQTLIFHRFRIDFYSIFESTIASKSVHERFWKGFG